MKVRRPSSSALALLAAALLGSSPARAQTADKPRQGAPILAASLSLACPFVPEVFLVLMSEGKLEENWSGMRAALYVASGLGFAGAATAFALEATTPGTCGKDCKGVYTTAVLGTVLSSLGMAAAVWMTVTSPKKKHHALVVPLVIPSEGRPAIGVGVVGTTF